MTRVITILATLFVALQVSATAVPMWTSPNHYRVTLTANPGALARKNSPAKVDIYFQDILTSLGSAGTFNEHTIEVIAYDGSGQPKVFDATRNGYEQYLLPWRIEKYFKTNQTTLRFVMPDHTYTSYCVYFDTVQSGLGKPTRYPGMVGDGDWFTEGYKRREINACGYDSWCDWDGDGDLDLFKGGTEPFIYCYENVGGNKMVDRGRLTDNGSLKTFPAEAQSNRSWQSCSFYDWDGDGDQDLFLYAVVGSDGGRVAKYENTAAPGARPIWTHRGQLRTTSYKYPGATINFVDWDNNGRPDVISNEGGLVVVYLNASADNSVANMVLADGFYLQANGEQIYLESAQPEMADIDTDGDLDLFLGSEDGRIYFFKNVGTRTAPVFTMGRYVAFYEFMDLRSRVKVADWDGDGLLDFVAGRFWERTQWGEQPRFYGALYKNVGTASNPRFEAKDAYNGSPYTERFQNADAVRQNGIRSVDWNNDGRTDLIASDTDGWVWLFRNTTNHLFPVFAAGEKILAAGVPIRVYGEEAEQRAAGYARNDIVDWNNDGKKDMLVADGRGYLWLHLNEGTDANPVLGAGTRVSSRGPSGTTMYPIDGNSRSNVLVCDWNRDGKKDVIFGFYGIHPWMTHPAEVYSKNYNWPVDDNPLTTERWDEDGFLYYRNLGTDAAPILAYPSWIYAGGSRISYSRPNLGSFIDWNGDGIKDFIGCSFENDIYLYTNSNPSGTPSLAARQTIVHPWTYQMCSGADARDFNGDGDIDILTGMGHGGSGLRFYERDYINDYTNNGNTYPIVTAGTSDRGLELAEAKAKGNGASANLPGSVVSASFTNYFYVESPDRLNGIRVEKTAHGKLVGNKVDIVGPLATNAHGEKYISNPTLTANGTGSVPTEMVLSGKGMGGADRGYVPATGEGQMGITGGIGPNNIGLLVRIFGKVKLNVRGDFYGNNYIFVDDGSGIIGRYRASDGSYVQVHGVKVEVDDATITTSHYVAARGVSSIELVDGVYQSRLLPRAGMSDITKMASLP